MPRVDKPVRKQKGQHPLTSWYGDGHTAQRDRSGSLSRLTLTWKVFSNSGYKRNGELDDRLHRLLFAVH
jgi:hypothetical protein